MGVFMEIIKHQNGSITYRSEIFINGLRFKSPTFTRKTDAIQWKAKKLVERDEAKRLGYEYKKKERFTFFDYSQTYLNEKIKVQRSKSTYDNHKRALDNHFYPVLGSLYLEQITSKHADKIIETLLTTKHNENGTNQVMQILRSILLDAEKNDFIHKSPLRNYPTLKKVQRPATFWSNLEINQFLQANVSNPLYHLFVIALNTGMRKGELAGLCWDKVDFQRSMIEVGRIRDRHGLRCTTKTGIVRHVPMNDVVKATLLKLFGKANSNFVFIRPNGDSIEAQHIYRDFIKAQKIAKIERLIRFHDLRHCFASHIMMNGGNLYDLQKVLGHTKIDMTQIYAHLSPEHLAGVTQIVAFGGTNIKSHPKVTHPECNVASLH